MTAEICKFEPGDRIDGDWLVDSFLGEGTFGQVFRVKDSRGTPFALKLLKLWEIEESMRPNLLKRFDREYETGRIDSDYLVQSVEKGLVRGNAYIVMEYCKGGDLHSAMNKGPLDLALLASHVLLGLRDLHHNGKVHRDLKPENVLLRDKNHAVLTDFGISGDQNNRLTQRGWSGVPKQRFGTLAYMPPEQLNPKRGNATVLPTTDIFSFGVMMYRLLTGQFPFGAFEKESDVAKYLSNVMKGVWDRQRLARMNDGSEWTVMIEGCLVPDFKNRLQTTDNVLSLLPKSKRVERDTPVRETASFKRDARNGILLRITQGEEHGRTYVLDKLTTDNISILFMGRKSEDVWNHICIRETESSYISRKHCTIERDRTTNMWILRDGQYRVACPVGLRSGSVMPCRTCTTHCADRVGRRMQWAESLNGTYINSREVPAEGMEIRPGDIISLGDVKMRVEGV